MFGGIPNRIHHRLASGSTIQKADIIGLTCRIGGPIEDGWVKVIYITGITHTRIDGGDNHIVAIPTRIGNHKTGSAGGECATFGKAKEGTRDRG